MDSGTLAAWVQAVGSILAIGSGFGTVFLQNRNAEKLREQDRADRAVVIAFKLSGWLGEMEALIQTTLEFHENIQKDKPQPNRITAKLKLEPSVGIESVMSELHYLKAGSGDVAQLDFFARFFDSYLDKTYAQSPFTTTEELDTYHTSVERQLKNMLQLCANAQRHLAPIVEAGLKKER
jgi:hypothetical protein